jgi:enamine deaminase RidA (YjgF/YER057c/UK114 family)
MTSRDKVFEKACKDHGLDPAAPLVVGGNYLPLAQDGKTVYLAGQIPKVGDKVIVTGKLGNPLTVPQGQIGARICVLRGLIALHQQLGSLDKIKSVLKLNVYIQCAPDFTLHSEVADGASDLLVSILGPAGAAPRLSVGCAQLPKNAAIELDFIVNTV